MPDDLRISDMPLKSVLAGNDRLPLLDSTAVLSEDKNKSALVSTIEAFVARGGRILNFGGDGGTEAVLAANSGVLHTNFGAYGMRVFQLPTPVVGLSFGFFRYEDSSAFTEVVVYPPGSVSLGKGVAGQGVRLVSYGDFWVRALQWPSGPMVWAILGGHAWTEYVL